MNIDRSNIPVSAHSPIQEAHVEADVETKMLLDSWFGVDLNQALPVAAENPTMPAARNTGQNANILHAAGGAGEVFRAEETEAPPAAPQGITFKIPDTYQISKNQLNLLPADRRASLETAQKNYQNRGNELHSLREQLVQVQLKGTFGQVEQVLAGKVEQRKAAVQEANKTYLQQLEGAVTYLTARTGLQCVCKEVAQDAVVDLAKVKKEIQLSKDPPETKEKKMALFTILEKAMSDPPQIPLALVHRAILTYVQEALMNEAHEIKQKDTPFRTATPELACFLDNWKTACKDCGITAAVDNLKDTLHNLFQELVDVKKYDTIEIKTALKSRLQGDEPPAHLKGKDKKFQDDITALLALLNKQTKEVVHAIASRLEQTKDPRLLQMNQMMRQICDTLAEQKNDHVRNAGAFCGNVFCLRVLSPLVSVDTRPHFTALGQYLQQKANDYNEHMVGDQDMNASFDHLTQALGAAPALAQQEEESFTDLARALLETPPSTNNPFPEYIDL